MARSQAPQAPQVARTIAVRTALSIAPQFVNIVNGFNKPAWRKRLAAELQTNDPVVAQELEGGATDELYAGIIEEAIRQSRGADPVVDTITDLARFKKRVAKDNRIVQIRRPDGAYIAKRMRDVTAAEFDTLALAYERSSASDARRGRYYRECARQMRLAGLQQSDPLSKLLGS